MRPFTPLSLKANHLLGRSAALAALVAAGCVGSSCAAQQHLQRPGNAIAAASQAVATTDECNDLTMLLDSIDANPEIPRPDVFLRHEIGDGAVRYDEIMRYLFALADTSDRVAITAYGRTHEGRTLYYATITSPANHAQLDDIQTANALLADPRQLTDPGDLEAIIDALPGVAWMAYSIHGDELSSSDAAIVVAYVLAAGADEHTLGTLDELVIHIDPLMNADGRERYLAQLQTLVGKVSNTDYQSMQHGGLWSAGRGNHYLFDLNRDWLMQVHPETRGRAREIRAWHPHLLVDSHEMGSLDTYLFDPPREPLNVHISEQSLDWRRVFSGDQAAAFDRHGWSYYTREWYEEWYPGYTNAWGGLQGAIGILYEQAGVNGAAIKQASGGTLTYAEAVHHHVVSSLANIESLRANRQAILRDFHADRAWAVSDEGPFNEIFLSPPTRDIAKRGRFLDLLDRQGVEYTIAEDEVVARAVTGFFGGLEREAKFPPGTIIVRSNQPQRRLLHAMLGFDPHMTEKFLTDERTELERRRGSKLYDVTAWNIPMAYGLPAYWAEIVTSGAPDEGGGEPAAAPRTDLGDGAAGYGYLIDVESSDLFPAMTRLFDADCRLRVASKPFTLAGVSYRSGAILLRAHENPENLHQTLAELAGELQIIVRRVDSARAQDGPDLGGQRLHLLEQPRVAIASQWPVSTTSFGATWFLFDARSGLRVSPINIQSLGGIDLRNYNVLILPNSFGGGLRGVLNSSTRERLASWVENGGTLIAMGGSAAYLADESSGLSNVRLKRNVLDELDVYDQAIAREREAHDITVDFEAVWGDSADADDAASEENSGGKVDSDALEREDAWNRIFSPQGTIVASTLDPEHWLCFGLGERLPVLLSGSNALMSMHPIATPARFVEADDLRLSGLMWPEARQRWAGTAYCTVERRGRGQVILFVTEPFFRGYYEGSGRLLLNAVLLGPGMGASQPVPW